MQIKLNTDYALRILTYLSIKRSVVNSKAIADCLDIPQKNVLSIGRELKAANYVNIISGPYGGYKINKEDEDILLLDVISIFESTKINCHSEGKKGSQVMADVVVNCLYSELKDMIEEKLRSETLADLISKSKRNKDYV